MSETKEITQQLLDLPENIKKQSTELMTLFFAIEVQRLATAQIKNQHLDTVLNAKSGDTPTYSNDKARQVALDKLLQKDAKYNEIFTALQANEEQKRIMEIELEYLHNLFSAYRAIAGMLSGV